MVNWNYFTNIREPFNLFDNEILIKIKYFMDNVQKIHE